MNHHPECEARLIVNPQTVITLHELRNAAACKWISYPQALEHPWIVQNIQHFCHQVLCQHRELACDRQNVI